MKFDTPLDAVAAFKKKYPTSCIEGRRGAWRVTFYATDRVYNYRSPCTMQTLIEEILTKAEEEK